MGRHIFFIHAGNASEPIPVFYQGCYNSSEMTETTSTSGDCEQECNHTRFFANATDVRPLLNIR